MHEKLQFALHGSTDGADLVQRKLSLQNEPPEPQRLPPPCLFRRANHRLRRGEQRQGGQFQFQQSKVLNDKSIHSCLGQLPHLFSRSLQLVVEQDGVDHGVDACVVAMGIAGQFANLRYRIAGGLTGAEAGACDIDGIGTAVNRRDADVSVSGRSQEL